MIKRQMLAALNAIYGSGGLINWAKLTEKIYNEYNDISRSEHKNKRENILRNIYC